MWKGFPIGLGALGPVFFIAVASAAVVPFGPQAAGDQAAYTLAYSGQFWQGDSTSYNGTLTLTREDSSHVDAAWASTNTAIASGGPNGLGGIDVSSQIEWMDPYNTVAQLLYPIGGDVKLGITWPSEIPVHVNPGELVQVPVAATVTATERGHNLTITFTGERTGDYSYSGFIVPIDVAVKGTIGVVDGHVAQCEYDVQEDVHLGGSQTQNISWEWTLSPYSP
ncbi:MAG TPA: hypothetical protein VME66_14225 [Candidatus Acidoferrales bacterium]|nr:hypothetical protein [Candidatus Acidoferrales bacterium]